MLCEGTLAVFIPRLVLGFPNALYKGGVFSLLIGIVTRWRSWQDEMQVDWGFAAGFGQPCFCNESLFYCMDYGLKLNDTHANIDAGSWS
jgi:hypothetical protein